MAYYLCNAKDHYVTARRGERLESGGNCPVKGCPSKLRHAPTTSTTCPGCEKGLLLPVEVDGLNVELCSYCGQSRLVADESLVPVARAMTGAERVAKHRAAKRQAK